MLTSLEALWSHFGRGDKQVNTEMIHTCANSMFRYGIRFVPGTNFIRDCMQEVFVDLWDNREKIEAGQIKTFLFKALRAEIFRRRLGGRVDTSMQDDHAFPMEFDLDSPPGRKELLYLRLYEGFAPDQIAEIMGLNKENFANLTLHGS
jgi:DNA-directed RNA polymerase specialized sigma24 family protein